MKIPWRRERLPTPVFWPGDFRGLYSPWGLQRVQQDWSTFTFIQWEGHHSGDWLAGGEFRWLDLGALPAVQCFQHLLIPAVQTRQMFPADLQLLPLQYFTMWKTNSPIFQRWSSPHRGFLHVASFAFKMFISSPIFSFSCMSRGGVGGGSPLSFSKPNIYFYL